MNHLKTLLTCYLQFVIYPMPHKNQKPSISWTTIFKLLNLFKYWKWHIFIHTFQSIDSTRISPQCLFFKAMKCCNISISLQALLSFKLSIVLEKYGNWQNRTQRIEKFTPGRGKNNSNIFFTQTCKPRLLFML